MKKVIATILSVLMLAGSLSVLAGAQEFVYESQSMNVGDANYDGEINARDVLALRRYMADESYVINLQSADVNNDSTADARDVLLLRRGFAGMVDIGDYDRITDTTDVKIAGNSITAYSIVIPEGTSSDDNVNYAAMQLQRYIRLACDYTPAVITSMPESGKAIVLHAYDELSSEAQAMNLKIENYVYEVTDGQLNIYGTRRGNMYAVYEILEDYFGYRFYFDSYTYVERQCANIPEGTYVFHEPELSFRFIDQGFKGGNTLYHYFPRRLNGTQIYQDDGTKYGTLTGPHFINAHSYGYYYRMASGNAAETDYYAKYQSGYQQKESSWNPCFTSGDTYEYLFRGLLETMRMIQTWSHVFRRETSSMSFSICDNPTVCSCNACKFISTTGVQRGKKCLGAGTAGLNIYLANKAARDIRAYYPGRAADNDDLGEVLYDEYPDMKIFTILYEHTAPVTNVIDKYKDWILPEENLIIMFCGTACNNHYMKDAATECGTSRNNLNQSNAADIASLKAWGEVCNERGAELWFWYYPVTYNMYLIDSPVIFNIYYDFKYMVEECYVTGIFYEGGGQDYQFQNLKSHLASMMLWDPHMSYEQYIEYMMDYLRMYYGAGYNEIFDYIVLADEAANAISYDSGINTAGCFVNNFDRPGDMYDYEYTRDHYEEMRALLEAAYAKTEDATQQQRIEYLLVTCDFMGLSANYEGWYRDGSTEQRQLYIDRYTWMYNYIKDNDMEIFTNDTYTTPDTLDVSVKPLNFFYDEGSWNENNADVWGYSPAPQDGWGYQQ